MIKQVCKVVIVGAGPAGTIAAYVLAKSGVNIILVDQKKFPREKICGDTLAPDGIKLLENLGLFSTVQSKGYSVNKAEIIAPNGNSFLFQSKFLTIRRINFDNVLKESAINAGAKFFEEAQVESPIIDDKLFVGVKGKRKNVNFEIYADIIILATGANSIPLKTFQVLEKPIFSAIAGRCYFEKNSTHYQDQLVISFDKSIMPGYGWIFPLGEGIYNVGCGMFFDGKVKHCNLRNLFDRFQNSNDLIREILSGAKQISPFKGAPLRTAFCGAKPYSNNLLVIGEAIGLTYSLTGEGIGKAVESGQLAGEVAYKAVSMNDFSADFLSRYKAIVEEKFRGKFQNYLTGQKWLQYPMIANFLIWKARRSQTLTRAFEKVLNEECEPTEIFSIRNILKSLWM